MSSGRLHPCAHRAPVASLHGCAPRAMAAIVPSIRRCMLRGGAAEAADLQLLAHRKGSSQGRIQVARVNLQPLLHRLLDVQPQEAAGGRATCGEGGKELG